MRKRSIFYSGKSLSVTLITKWAFPLLVELYLISCNVVFTNSLCFLTTEFLKYGSYAKWSNSFWNFQKRTFLEKGHFWKFWYTSQDKVYLARHTKIFRNVLLRISIPFGSSPGFLHEWFTFGNWTIFGFSGTFPWKFPCYFPLYQRISHIPIVIINKYLLLILHYVLKKNSKVHFI